MSRFFLSKFFSSSTANVPESPPQCSDVGGAEETPPPTPVSTCTLSSASSYSSSLSLQGSRCRTSSNSSSWFKSIFGRRSPAIADPVCRTTRQLSPPISVQVELADDAIDLFDLNAQSKFVYGFVELVSNSRLIRSLPFDCTKSVNGFQLRPTKPEFASLGHLSDQRSSVPHNNNNNVRVPVQCPVDSVKDKIGIVLVDNRGICGYRQMSREFENQLVIVMQGLKSMNTIARSKQPADRLKPFYESITEMIYGSIALSTVKRKCKGDESIGSRTSEQHNSYAPKKMHRLRLDGSQGAGANSNDSIEIFMNSFVFETNFSGRPYRSKFGIACFWLCDNNNNNNSLEKSVELESPDNSNLPLTIKSLILNCPDVIKDCMNQFRNELVKSKLYSTKCVEIAAAKMIYSLDQFINAIRFVPRPLPKSEIIGEFADLWKMMNKPSQHETNDNILAANKQNFMSNLLSTILSLTYKQDNLKIVLWASEKRNSPDAERIEKIAQLVRIVNIMNHFRCKVWNDNSDEEKIAKPKLELKTNDDNTNEINVVPDTWPPKPNPPVVSQSNLEQKPQKPALRRTSKFICDKNCVADSCLHGFENVINCLSERSSSSSNSSNQTNQSAYSCNLSMCNHLLHHSQSYSMVSSNQKPPHNLFSDFNYRKSRDESIGYQSLTSSNGNSGRCSPTNCCEAILQNINDDVPYDNSLASKSRIYSFSLGSSTVNDDVVKTGHYHYCHDCIKKCPRCMTMSNTRFLKSRNYFRGYVNLRQDYSQSPTRALTDDNLYLNYDDLDSYDFIGRREQQSDEDANNTSGSNSGSHFFLPSSSVETVINAAAKRDSKPIFTVGTPDIVYKSVSSSDLSNLDRLLPTIDKPPVLTLSPTIEPSLLEETSLFPSPTLSYSGSSLPMLSVQAEVSTTTMSISQKPTTTTTIRASPLVKVPHCLEVKLTSFADHNPSDSNNNNSKSSISHNTNRFPVIMKPQLPPSANTSFETASAASAAAAITTKLSSLRSFDLSEYPLLSTCYLKYSLSQVVIVELDDGLDHSSQNLPFEKFISKINNELSETKSNDTLIVCNCDQWTVNWCDRFTDKVTQSATHISSKLVHEICKFTPIMYSQLTGSVKADKLMWQFFISKFRSICFKSEILWQMLTTDRYKLFKMDPLTHDKLVKYCDRMMYELDNINSDFSARRVAKDDFPSLSSNTFGSHLYLYKEIDELLAPDCAKHCTSFGFDPSDWPVMIGLRKQIRLDKSKRFKQLFGLQACINICDDKQLYAPITPRFNTRDVHVMGPVHTSERKFQFNFLFNVDFDEFDTGIKPKSKAKTVESSFLDRSLEPDVYVPEWKPKLTHNDENNKSQLKKEIRRSSKIRSARPRVLAPKPPVKTNGNNNNQQQSLKSSPLLLPSACHSPQSIIH